MNKDERKKLHKLEETVSRLLDEVNTVLADIQDMEAAEQEKFDNLSEGLQASDMGQKLETSAQALQELAVCLETARDNLDEALGHFGDAAGE